MSDVNWETKSKTEKERQGEIQAADHLIAIEFGELVELGLPAEVLKAAGIYRKLRNWIVRDLMEDGNLAFSMGGEGETALVIVATAKGIELLRSYGPVEAVAI